MDPDFTFLFSDIESSTRRWEHHPDSMAEDLARHDEIVRRGVEASGGEVFGHTGDGMCAAFRAGRAAVDAAVSVQQALREQAWASPTPLRVRMAVHTGPAQRRAANYFGPTLNRTARLLSVGSGGQVLCSRATAERIRADRPDGVDLLDLGEHRLADLSRPEQVFQVAHPGLPQEFPPLRSLGLHRNNLPVAMNAFIGRAAELAELDALLGRTRLLSVVGAGGAGKTRLALHVGAASVEAYPDGVWIVELASVRDPGQVAPAVAAALGIDTAGRATPEAMAERLNSYLQTRRVLLVIDNCEHLIESAAHLIHELLTHCPNVTVLATSREVLGLPGEIAWRVPPLSLPGAKVGDLSELVASDAVALFLERAATACPGFELAAGNADAVAQICRRLDGIPLALELAAARVSVLGVHQVADRLDDCFRLLTGGARTAVSRHQTLRATLDWSHALLPPVEQAALRRLAAFPAGFGLDAAEAVLLGVPGTEPPTRADSDAVDLLVLLVDKSLVVVSSDAGQHRYRLLEPVRQYARERLAAAGEEDAVARRHRDFFLGLSQGWGNRMFLEERVHRVTIDEDSFAAALHWSLETGDFESALALTATLWLLWFFRGQPGAHHRLNKVLVRTAHLEVPARVEVLCALSAMLPDDPAGQGASFAEAVALARSIDDDHCIAALDFVAGEAALLGGDRGSARARLEHAKVLYEGLDYEIGVGHCEDQLGWVAVDSSDHDAARAHFARAAAIARALGSDWLGAQAGSALAPLLVIGGDPGAGLRLADEAIVSGRRAPVPLVLVMTLVRAAETALLADDVPRAVDRLRESLRRMLEIGTERYVADCLELVALAHGARHEAAPASAMLCAAAARREAVGSVSGVRFLADTVRARREQLAVELDPDELARLRTDARDLTTGSTVARALAGLRAE